MLPADSYTSIRPNDDLERARSLTSAAVTRSAGRAAAAASTSIRPGSTRRMRRLKIARLNLERLNGSGACQRHSHQFRSPPGLRQCRHSCFALLGSDTVRVEGYSRKPSCGVSVSEKMRRKQLIGDPRRLSGHVESIAYGIEDQNRSTSSNLLASVNPTFSWVRLAQRIPVRIKLDNVPPDLLLAAGRTATVSIGKISW